jgi:Fe-S cluster assembly iron-binding protein IscA
LALDEPKETDETFDKDGIKFLIDKELYGQTQPVTVDYIDTPTGGGFKVTSSSSKNSTDCCGTCSC